MEETAKHDQAVQILRKQPDQRTESEMEQLLPLLKNIEFFKKNDFKDSDYHFFCDKLRLETVPPEKYIMRVGKPLHLTCSRGLRR
jgi:hypothetical protein